MFSKLVARGARAGFQGLSGTCSASRALSVLPRSQQMYSKLDFRTSSLLSCNNLSMYGGNSTRALSSTATQTPFNAKPSSLEIPDDSPDLADLPMHQKLLLRFAGYNSKDSQITRGTEKLYNEIVAQSTNDEIFKALKLENNFRGQFSVTALHIWLSLARLRSEGAVGKQMSQKLYDDWWEDVQKRVRDEGVRVRVSKWLKELEEYFYGSCVAYDAALKEEPGELVDALWRNVYGAEGDKAGAVACAKYLRRELASISLTDGKAILNGSRVEEFSLGTLESKRLKLQEAHQKARVDTN